MLNGINITNNTKNSLVKEKYFVIRSPPCSSQLEGLALFADLSS